MVDEGTRKTLSNIPLLKTKAGPRDKELWVSRLKEEYQSLIKVWRPFERIIPEVTYAEEVYILFFSMFKIIKMRIMIGLD